MARKIRMNLPNPRGGIDYNILIVIGLGYLAYHYNAAGIRDLFRAISDGTLGGLGGTWGSGGLGGGGGGSGGLAVPDAAIAGWAADIGLSVNVGRRFVADRGRLPASVDELVTWGNSKGYRLPNGEWTI